MTSDGARSEKTAWIKASFCQGGECAELLRQGEEVLLRSTRSPADVVRLTSSEWKALAQGITAGEFSHLV
jgi:hypothetical protein